MATNARPLDHVYGVITSAQLERGGITKDVLPRRPEYERLAKGHYAMPGARRDFWFDGALALSIAGEDARLTSDASLHAVGVLPQRPVRIRVVVPEGKGSRKRRGADVRRSSHLPDDVIALGALRSVPISYAVTDYARDAGDKAVAFAISGALGLRLTSLRNIRAVLDDRGQFPGSARLRRVLEDFGGAESHSARERALRRTLVRLGDPPDEGQHDIRDRDGRIIRRADIPYALALLDVEVDGPHHLLPAQQAKDRTTDRLVRGLGWDVVRFTTYEIDEDVGACARQVLDILRARRQLGQAAA